MEDKKIKVERKEKENWTEEYQKEKRKWKSEVWERKEGKRKKVKKEL